MTSITTLSATIEDRSLADLLGSVTASVIIPVVRRNLYVSLRDDDTTSENQNALDLVGDIQVALLAALESGGSNGRAIENIDAYAATIAANACYQYLRTKFPVRAQQMNKLRYLLTHDQRFEMFKANEVWHCKLAGKGSDTGRSGNKEREKYAHTVVALLRKRDSLALDELVSEVMETLGLRDRMPLDSDDPFGQLADSGAPADRRLETVDRLRQLWRGVLQLPLKHRKALLLNLSDRDGGLIWMLPTTGVASIADIAGALEMTSRELAEIWNTLPWNDLKIGEHLGVRRQQVINLRQSARAKLMRYEDR